MAMQEDAVCELGIVLVSFLVLFMVGLVVVVGANTVEMLLTLLLVFPTFVAISTT